jgi:hypothetical protein
MATATKYFGRIKTNIIYKVQSDRVRNKNALVLLFQKQATIIHVNVKRTIFRLYFVSFSRRQNAELTSETSLSDKTPRNASQQYQTFSLECL